AMNIDTDSGQQKAQSEELGFA
ncbi:MAG: hypothetical protein V7606_156, partial [Burkholderiales bacterium]